MKWSEFKKLVIESFDENTKNTEGMRFEYKILNTAYGKHTNNPLPLHGIGLSRSIEEPYLDNDRRDLFISASKKVMAPFGPSYAILANGSILVERPYGEEVINFMFDKGGNLETIYVTDGKKIINSAGKKMKSIFELLPW